MRRFGGSGGDIGSDELSEGDPPQLFPDGRSAVEDEEDVWSVESGCPAPLFSRECGIVEKKRCSDNAQCGNGRLCCPSLHPKLNDYCNYCTAPVGNADDKVCPLHQ